MAGVSDGGVIKAGPWPAGVDNTSQEAALVADEYGRVRALREAVNVDLSAMGRPRRRRGYAGVVAGSAHSLWSMADLPFALVVLDGVLSVLGADGGVAALSGAPQVGLPLSYTYAGGVVYACNAAVGVAVTPSLEVWGWAPPQPDGQPALAVTGGALLPGRYQIAVTYVDAAGRESGSTLAAEVELPTGGGIAASGITPPPGVAALLYCSGANDTVLRLAGGIHGTATVSAPAEGRALGTQFLEPLPTGQTVRVGHGRLWVARGNELFWSEPLRYGLYNPARNRMRFNAPIDLLEPIGDGTGGAGVYVAAGNHTYWYGDADPAKWTQAAAAHSGAIPGGAIVVKGTAVGLGSPAPVLVWLARSGKFVVGAPGGQLTEVKNPAAVDTADRAALLLRDDRGDTFITASLRAPTKHALAVTDVATAHIVSRAR